ncbi:hypothetical protein ACV22V_25540 [Burkholderia sp. AW33-5]
MGISARLTIRRNGGHAADLTLHAGILSALVRRMVGPVKMYRTNRGMAHSAHVRTQADVIGQCIAGAPRNAPAIVVVMRVVFGSGAPTGPARPTHLVLGKPSCADLLLAQINALGRDRHSSARALYGVNPCPLEADQGLFRPILIFHLPFI